MNANLDPAALRTQERAEAQRDRILDAAGQCFTEHGFHAATIANIAETAQISAGLIYRYFENKNAIVLAIIARQLRQARRDIAALQTGDAATPADMVPRLAMLWHKCNPRDLDPVLFLEMSAEASRNEDIAQALRHADRTSADDFSGWLDGVARVQDARPSPAELRARGIAMRSLIAGLAVVLVRDPDIDPEDLCAAIGMVVPALLAFDPTH